MCYYYAMDLQSLTAIGLSHQQASAYALLIEHGEVKPALAAQRLKTTRTNAYKILDKLVELKLAQKLEQGKTFVYAPSNPMSLATLTANYRAEAVHREEAVAKVMQELLEKYYKHTDSPTTEVVTGRAKVAEAYRKQLKLRENVYFIHTNTDVPMMGFDIMHELRVTPARTDNKRFAIMARPDSGLVNHAQHQRSNLEITWAQKGLYSAPVEWSVTTSSLLIVLYATEPHAILIVDKVVAGAFLQIWQMLSTLLRQQAAHTKTALTA